MSSSERVPFVAPDNGIAETLLGIAADGARPHQKRFALERLAKIRMALLRDGATDLDPMISDVEYVAAMVRGMQ